MITVIIGTNRPGAKSRHVGHHIASLYSDLGVETRTLDLADLPPDAFDPSVYETKPPSFAPFAEAVLASNGLVVVTPEYNGGMPGILKYFIDLLPFPESFQHRPVAFVGVAAGQWGALRPVEQLQAIFGYRNAYVFPERVFLPSVHKLIDADGKLADHDVRDRLAAQTAGFIEFVEKLRGVQLSTED